MRPLVQIGHIWRAVDPRLQRFVRIDDVGHHVARITTVYRTDEGTWKPLYPHARTTGAQLSRFNGKRGGYEFVEVDPT